MFNYSRVLDIENKNASFVTSELPKEYTKNLKDCTGFKTFKDSL
jgi:hypothetical protein